MPEPARPAARVSLGQMVIGAVLAVWVVILGLRVAVLRPYLWPAGAGLALSADAVFGQFGERASSARIRLPDVSGVAGTRVTVTRVWTGGSAERENLHEGLPVYGISGASGLMVDVSAGVPNEPAGVLRLWRELYNVDPRSSVTIRLAETMSGTSTRTVTLPRTSILTVDRDGQWIWTRQHLGSLVQMTAFLAGGAALLVLGARGTTATLMTLALVATGVPSGGPLLGAQAAVPLVGPLLLFFSWIATPLAFPVIGVAVLYFPRRAAILDRQRWIIPGLCLAALPMFITGVMSAVFLIGVDSVLPALTWLAERPWTFDASFAVALAANVLIAIDGISRYRGNLDANERRRIQIVVFTGVPAVFAYAVKSGVPLLGGLFGRQIELPWTLVAVLQAIVLLPVIGLPYAVAVRRVFSPRTVLRRSLQYAFARRTLAVLALLPVVALAVSLVQERDQSLAAIVGGRPMFYVLCLVLAGLGLRYRDRAQAWLDRRFFRAEYDAREILVSLAGRVSSDADPRDLVTLVVNQIDSALHPECLAVLAGVGRSFDVITALRVETPPLPADCALVTLLRWSDKPLDVFLDDEQSPVARLPSADRAWLEAANAALLVPIFAGGSNPRPLVGFGALGPKRSEEPYASEDRLLLSGIAAQMGVALDLSRLRQRVGEAGTPVESLGLARTTMAVGGSGRGIGVGVVVDNKYRIDEVVGQGGMGAVYRAWDLRLERSVAIKVVRADLLAAPESRARFRRESQMVARLQHPAIVTVFDYGNLPDGAAFLVMEYVPGEDLRRLLKREGPLDIARASSLIQGIAGGVDAAHKSGILHRDLKPENILLPESGTGPKVVDFGVAKMANASAAGGTTLTAGGTIVGTPAYMAPEQLRGGTVDGRADVFSLGVMAFEMLTGRLPYGAGSFIDIGIRQAEGDASVDTSGLSSPIAGVLRRAIAFDRDARPESPLVLAHELEKASRERKEE